MEAETHVAELPAASPVKAGLLDPGDTLPLVLSPARDRVDLATWAAENRDYLEASLLVHGAILFRGFALASPSDLERVAAAVCPELFGDYGDLPREGVNGKVYASTPYPAHQAILFHNESSHLPRWPRKLFFCCLKASETGGETPLLDCREVVRRLDPPIFERFAEKGLTYVRNFCEGIDVSWQHFFKTDDREAVERICAEGGMRCEWVRGRTLRIRQRARAVVRHPRTGDAVFFNQVQLHHPHGLDAATRKALLALFKEDGLPRHVHYGDGTPIEDAVMAELDRLYWRTARVFPWREGDLVVLDNMRVAHARKPFTGARKIVVAMGEMVSATDVAG